MYTRSYGNHRAGVRTPLPPDYGGTALVIRQPETMREEQTTGREERSLPPAERRRRGLRGGAEGRNPAEGAPGEAETEDLAAGRKSGEGSPSRPEESAGSAGGRASGRGREKKGGPPDFRPPFGEGGGVGDAEQTSSNGGHGLLDPEHLKSDDLLLLGLLFLLFRDGAGGEDGSREALLILAVLYLSGL